MKRYYLKTMTLLLVLWIVPQWVSATLLSVTAKKTSMNGNPSSGYFLVYQLSVGESGIAPSYKSSNSKICTVNANGLVTFSAKGEATITLNATGYDATEITLSSDQYALTSDCDLTSFSASQLTTVLKRVNSNVSSATSSPKGFASMSTTRVRFGGSLNGSYGTLLNSFLFKISGDYFYTFVGQGAQCENGKTTVAIANAVTGQVASFFYKIPDSGKTPTDVEVSTSVLEASETFSMANKTLLQGMKIYTPMSALAQTTDVKLEDNTVDLSNLVIDDTNVTALATAISGLSNVSDLKYVKVGHIGYKVTDAQLAAFVPSDLSNSCFVKLPASSYYEKFGPNLMSSNGTVYSYVLNPSKPYAPAASFKVVQAKVLKTYTSTTEAYALSLPFAIDYVTDYGTVYAADKVNANGSINFVTTDEIKAGQPYLFSPSSETPFASLANITFEVGAPQTVKLDNRLSFTGFYSASDYPSNALRYEGKSKKFVKTTSVSGGMSAYLFSTSANEVEVELEKVINPIDTISNDRPIGDNEKLTRGLVALPSKTLGIYLSWRMLSDDDDNTTFDVLRDGKVIKSNIALATSYNDEEGTVNNKYQVVTRHDGNIVETSPEVTPWDQIFKQIPIDKPAGGKLPDGNAYSYRPNDCSTGDVDGDGEYEIILKWDSAPSYDNSQNGYTAPTLLDCYKLDGTKLWRVDLGSNIRSGAHYTQFLVYDFDGDGKAEMICKTAPGSKDGAGRYVSEAATDKSILAIDNTKKYVNSKGHVTGGEELLTVFNGQTGKAIHTIYYNPNRGMGYGGVGTYSSDWGDGNVPYNRGERYLACVAHLDGAYKSPSAVMCRGYYTRAYLWAVNFDGRILYTNWLHASTRSSEWTVTDKYGKTTTKTGCSATAYAQGAHNLSVGDLDGDGCDEIMYGSAAINNDGTLLYSTDLRHGDAQHLADLDPDREGLEFFMVLENGYYGFNMRNAKTGKVYVRKTGKSDTGRGMAADIDPDYRGYEMWSSASSTVYNCEGDSISNSRPSYDFRIYWDGDLQDELLGDMSNHNQPFLEKWDSKTKKIGRFLIGGQNLYAYGKSRTCNSTKGTPCLTADLFGDWREEMVFWCGTDSAHLNIFTTNEPTEYRFPTLMHDHIYRMGVAWQNVAYNQPPHLGYYLPDYALTRFVNVGEGTSTQTVEQGRAIVPISYRYAHCKDVTLEGNLPEGLSMEKKDSVWTISGTPKQMGTYTFVVKSFGDVSLKSISHEVTIEVEEATGISNVDAQEMKAFKVYNLNGFLVNEGFVENEDVTQYVKQHLPAGVYVVVLTDGMKTDTQKVVNK